MPEEILLFIFDGFADWEPAFTCAEINFSNTGYVVKTVAFDKEAKTSMAGIHVIPDYSVNEVPSVFALLLLPGGYPWMEHKNDAVLPLVNYAVQNKIPVASICNACNFMADNGFLDNIRHTGNTLEFMKEQAPNYKGEKLFCRQQAVCDNNIITANGSAALEFACEIFKLLKIKTKQEIIEWYTVNKKGLFQ